MKRSTVACCLAATLCVWTAQAQAQEVEEPAATPTCEATADEWTAFRLSLIDWVNAGDVRSAQEKSKEALALVGDLKKASEACGCGRAHALSSDFRTSVLKLGASKTRVSLSEAGWEATAAMQQVIAELQSCDEMKPK